MISLSELILSPYLILVLLTLYGPYLYAIVFFRPSPPMLPHTSRILLLIAHPDDESMFFAPTVLALTQKYLGNHLKILCFSNGNSEGLGPVRKRELHLAAGMLGVQQAEDVLILEDSRFQDGMMNEWDTDAIAQTLEKLLVPIVKKGQSSVDRRTVGDQAVKSHIDILITFDADGVSSHPNHKALYQGARNFVKKLKERYPGHHQPVKLLTLSSTNMLRKYLGVVDVLPTVASAAYTSLVEAIGHRFNARRSRDRGARPMIIVSNFSEYRKAQRAMQDAHVSQMRWFRWGWIGMSRYMMINDLAWER